jgi:endogenous inhibitor of DNA gyrase (YacG/DUF329 family)
MRELPNILRLYALRCSIILQTAPSLTVGLPTRFTFAMFLLNFSVVTKCPTCDKPVEWQDNPWRPFCSERCKLIDFGRWADEEYRVPGQRVNPGEILEQPTPKSSDDED